MNVNLLVNSTTNNVAAVPPNNNINNHPPPILNQSPSIHSTILTPSSSPNNAPILPLPNINFSLPPQSIQKNTIVHGNRHGPPNLPPLPSIHAHPITLQTNSPIQTQSLSQHIKGNEQNNDIWSNKNRTPTYKPPHQTPTQQQPYQNSVITSAFSPLRKNNPAQQPPLHQNSKQNIQHVLQKSNSMSNYPNQSSRNSPGDESLFRQKVI